MQKITANNPNIIPFLGGIGALLISTIAIAFGSMQLFLFPILVIVFYISIHNFKILWLIPVILMPISMQLDGVVGASSLTIPTDPIALGLLLVFLLKSSTFKSEIIKMFSHPIVMFVIIYLLWMGVCTFTSTEKVISFKFLFSFFWHFAAFFFFSIIFFKDIKTIKNWMIYAMPFITFVVAYTIFNHANHGFTHRASYYSMQPFYKEHTAYAASIVFYVPVYFVLFRIETNKILRFLLFIAFSVILFGVISSYTRGAWLGLIGAFGVYFIVQFWRIIKYTIPFVLLFLAILVIIGPSTVFNSLNSVRSTGKGGIDEHMKSIVNVRTDESNLERFNRWVAAIKMLEEEPLFGWGPGSYAMNYATFQETQYKTSISTNRGDGGTTHSEYLLAASEMGYIGVIIVILWYLVCLFYGIRGFVQSRNKFFKSIYLISFTGLITFFIHAFFNNFLDQDKVAIPIMLAMAMIVACDIFHQNEAYSENEPNLGQFFPNNEIKPQN